MQWNLLVCRYGFDRIGKTSGGEYWQIILNLFSTLELVPIDYRRNDLMVLNGWMKRHGYGRFWTALYINVPCDGIDQIR